MSGSHEPSVASDVTLMDKDTPGGQLASVVHVEQIDPTGTVGPQVCKPARHAPGTRVAMGGVHMTPVGGMHWQAHGSVGITSVSPPFHNTLGSEEGHMGAFAPWLWTSTNGGVQVGLGAVATQTSAPLQGDPLDDDDDVVEVEDDEEEDDVAEVEEDDVALVGEPSPPVPSCGTGPGHPDTTAVSPAKSAATRPPDPREPLDLWPI
jgi:hypothetical protein